MPKKLLTIDDSKTIRMIVARAFKLFDLQILEAANGQEGLDVAAREKPDLIILDITMPIMDGYETLTKLKESADLKNIPVIMLTAEAGKENVLRIAKLGVRDYLVKPFKEDLVIERVSRVISLPPKAVDPSRKKQYTEALKILVVDDKPAIVDQIKSALGATSWKIEGQAQPKAATDFFNTRLPDAVLISLSLPDGAAFALFDALRPGAQARQVPILGISVKTALPEQERALHLGFAGIITKPIDPQDVHAKVVKALNLDTSGKYFAARDGALAITLPTEFNANVAEEVEKQLQPKINASVDAGSDKVVVDLSQLRTADAVLIKLCSRIVKLCGDLGLRYALVGSEGVTAECVNFAETQSWRFAGNWQDALASFARKEAA